MEEYLKLKPSRREPPQGAPPRLKPPRGKEPRLEEEPILEEEPPREEEPPPVEPPQKEPPDRLSCLYRNTPTMRTEPPTFDQYHQYFDIQEEPEEPHMEPRRPKKYVPPSTTNWEACLHPWKKKYLKRKMGYHSPHDG